MPTEYVDRCYLDVDGTTIECTSVTPKDAVELAPVNTMNPTNRAVGYTSGIPTFELSAVVPLPEGGHSVNFQKLMDDRTEFTATIEYPGGETLVYSRCRISEIEQGSEEGSRTDTSLTMMALSRYKN